jgi:hypothetical protein
MDHNRYIVRVSRRSDLFELRIDELLISARSLALKSAFDRLMQYERLLGEHVVMLGAGYGLPSPASPPPIERSVSARRARKGRSRCT